MQHVQLPGQAVPFHATIPEGLDAAERDTDGIAVVAVRREGAAAKVRRGPLDAEAGRADRDPRALVPRARSFKTADPDLVNPVVHGRTIARKAVPMQGWQSLLSLLGLALAVMGSPGPATLSVAAVGGAYGLSRSLAYVAGVVCGTSIVLLVVAAGLTTVLLSLPGIRPVLLAASVAYLLFLAWRIASAPPLAVAAQDGPKPSFPGGLVLGIANPKAYVAIAAVFAAGRLAADATEDSVLKVVVLAAMIVLIHVAWLFAGIALFRLLRSPAVGRALNIALALALLASALPALLGI